MDRPVAMGRGRGRVGPPSKLTDAEMHGFPPGFDFKNLDQSAQTLNIPKTLTGGRGLIVERDIPVDNRETGTEYAKRIRADEEAKAKENLSNPQPAVGDVSTPLETAIMDFEDVSTVMERDAADTLSVTSAFIGIFNPGINPEKALPIEALRTEILKQIKLNQITVIEGKTGCGKTTRVPMFIAEDICADTRRADFNIVVTQPRRIAAVSVATRVAQQKNVQLGGLVGYQIGMDRSCVTDATRLLYCTTGVLLQKLISKKSLDGFTHIIVDEVHERNVETDLLLMVIRKLLWMKPQSVKLILMSATFESEKFMDYFRLESTIPPLYPSKVTIDQEPAKLTGFYIDTPGLKEIVDKVFRIPSDRYQSPFKMDDPTLFPELMEAAVLLIDSLRNMGKNASVPGAILVFLPGLNEIKDLEGKLKSRDKILVLPLHSSVTDIEQQRVFLPAPHGYRKVILATNIAESSITVPDISVVIDFCLTKNLVMEAKTNFPMLQLEWASQANCIQRAGRAGRTREGRYIRLIPGYFWNYLKPHPDPEIKRTPLELCVLRVKKLDMGPAKQLLGLCPDPPALQDIRKAVLRLKRVGGLSIMRKIDGSDVYDEEDGELTSMGDIMAKLPIDINLSKLILIGYAFGFVHDAVKIAACLTIKTMFSRPHGEDLDAYMSRLAWANQSYSDLFAFLTAYDMYANYVNFVGGYGNKKKEKEINTWCHLNLVQEKRIKEVDALVIDLKKRLVDAGISLDEPPNLKTLVPNSELVGEQLKQQNARVKEMLLKTAICGAFYPNYFISNKLNEDNLNKMITSQSHHSSVQISNLPQNQGVLYVDQIKAIFSRVSESVDCDFEDTKAVLTFSGTKNPLKRAFDCHNYAANETEQIIPNETAVKRSVYIAVKMRQIRHPSLAIRLFNREAAEARMKEIQEKRSRANDRSLLRSGRFVVRSFRSVLPKPALPTPNELVLDVRVTALGDCGTFWARKAGVDLTRQIEGELGQLFSQTNPLGELNGFPRVGDIVRFVHEDTDMIVAHMRGQVVKIPKDTSTMLEIFRVDYGDVVTHSWDIKQDKILDISLLPADSLIKSPPQAFCCQLEGIKPAVYRNIHGVWEVDANKFFKSFFLEDTESEQPCLSTNTFRLTVYSVINDVAMIWEVRDLGMDEQFGLLSAGLVARGFAEDVAPSDRSKRDHENRRVVRENDAQTLGNKPGCSLMDDEDYDIGEIQIQPELSNQMVPLKGPFSPLELDFHGANFTTHGTRISVGGDSVNSVALECEPFSAPSRLLVAAAVTVGSESNKVVARDTTIMPPIPGLLSIICLLFSPRVELRTDKKKLVYIGALCGLGYDDVRDSRGRIVHHPRDHGNDIEVDFDTFITPSDISYVNLARYLMNSLLFDSGSLDTDAQQFRLNGDALFRRQDQIRTMVLQLLETKRMSMDRKVESIEKRGKTFEWGLMDESELHAVDEMMQNDLLSFLPLVRTVRGLSEHKFLKNLCDEHEILTLCLTTSTMTSVMDCVICGVKLMNMVQLQSHLESDGHVIRHHQIRLRMEASQGTDLDVQRERNCLEMEDEDEEADM